MNRINFQQSVGFPLETDILDEMQKSWNVLNALGNIVNDIAIISGCNVNGSSITDGIVFINGEVLEFRGGVTQTTVVIKQDITTREFEDGNTNDVLYTRYVTFGTATTNQYNWSDFKRGIKTAEIQALLDLKANQSTIASITTRLDELEAKNAVFSAGGGMVLWQKPVSLIPNGWAEVVDWRGRLPIGLDSSQLEFDTAGKTGGNKIKNISVTVPNIGYGLGGATNFGTQGKLLVASGADENGEFLESIRQSANGVNASSGDVDIMNPYRVAVFIEWIGI